MPEHSRRPTASTQTPQHRPAPAGGSPAAEGPAPHTASDARPSGARASGALDPAPPSAAAPDGAGPATPPAPQEGPAADAVRRSFYQQFFSTDETSLIAAFALNPTPEDELWLQRVVNRRLLARVPREGSLPSASETGDDAPANAADALAKLAHQLNAGTGRVAGLLREVRALGAEGWETPPQAAQAAAREYGPARDWKA